MKETLKFVDGYKYGGTAYKENDNIVIIDSWNIHRFKIWEKLSDVPATWFVWNIGKNMPDGWLPLARCIDPHNRPYDIDPDSLIAVPIKEAQTILKGACICDTKFQKMERKIRSLKEKGRSYDYERLEKAYNLLKKYGYNYGR